MVVTNAIYSNCRVLNAEGVLIFMSSRQRAEWYLSRGLADKTRDDPYTIRLRFETKGDGNAGDDYYLHEKVNQCVVCGSSERLTKHHIVPRVYRKHFPDSLKSRSSHDVVATCKDCHERYETEAWKFKKQLAIEAGYQGTIVKPVNVHHPVTKAAVALSRHRDRMPPGRVIQYETALREHYGREITAEDVTAACRLSLPPVVHPDFGKYVVERADVGEFVKTWRLHFLTVMNPQFMPEGWDAGRPLDYKEL